MSLEFISTPILHQRYSFLTSSFCHFNIWAWRVCAAQQGMLFASLSLKRGIEITLFLWKRVYFTLDLTLEQGRLFPEFWLITNHKRYKRRNWLSTGQLSGIGYLFLKFLSGIGFQIHLFFLWFLWRCIWFSSRIFSLQSIAYLLSKESFMRDLKNTSRNVG